PCGVRPIASIVVTALSPTLSTGVWQERTAWPSRCTVQAPQSAWPQPSLVPVIPSTSRSTHSSGVSPSTSTSWGVPLIFNVKAMHASLWLGLIRRSRPTWTAPAGRVRRLARVAPGRTRMTVLRAALGRVEGGDGIVEGRDVADVRPQSSVPHPLDDLTQLGTIGLDNEVDRQAVGGPRLRRPDDGHQCSSGSDQACG